jgi:hypothetical protein
MENWFLLDEFSLNEMKSTPGNWKALEVVNSFEMLVLVYQTTWPQVTEDSTLHDHRHEKGKMRFCLTNLCVTS